jgi:SAM-dependent methyltransferase
MSAISIYPTIFSNRYYISSQLRKQIEFVVKNYVEAKERLLDYGSGTSPYRLFFKEAIKEYVSADIKLNETAQIHLDDRGCVPLKDKFFDYVLSTQVLEHVDDPKLYLSEAKRLLKNDGLLILSTHGYWLYHPTPNDYWRWTSAGLKKILNESGFEIVYFKGILNRSAVGIQLFQDGLFFKLPSFLRPFLCFFTQLGIILFDKLSSNASRNADACDYVIVAKLK